MGEAKNPRTAFLKGERASIRPINFLTHLTASKRSMQALTLRKLSLLSPCPSLLYGRYVVSGVRRCLESQHFLMPSLQWYLDHGHHLYLLW